MLEKMPNPQSLLYASILRNANSGWTPASREGLSRWLNEASLRKGGENYSLYLEKIRKDAESGAVSTQDPPTGSPPNPNE